MSIPFFNRISASDKAFFARQIATMISSGLTLDKALQVVISQTKNKNFREILQEILAAIESGSPFSAAIAKHPQVFDKVFVNIVVSGEAVGKLGEVLSKLADQLEADNTFYTAIRNAMLYPVFVLAVMIVIAILMTVKVLPELENVFAEFQSSLPWTTQLLMSVSHFLMNYWWLIIVILASAVILLYYYFKTRSGRIFLDKSIIRMPGGLGTDIYMTRFCRTLGMLTQSGTPIIDALKITADVMNNLVFKEYLTKAADKLERGIPLSDILKKSPDFPIIVPQMVMVGEQTGKVDESLMRLASYYEERANAKVKNIATLIEPVLIVIIGLGVAFIVFSVIMPIYNLAQIQ
ncbi:MAG: type II secretion system F family protein [Patescibacteria group bacterium]|nr:type II secretion system F family protein [Patescibacteria group bacterium]